MILFQANAAGTGRLFDEGVSLNRSRSCVSFSFLVVCAILSPAVLSPAVLSLTGGLAAADDGQATEKAATDKPPTGYYVHKVGGLNKKIYKELLARWGRTGTDQKVHFAPLAKKGEPVNNEGDRYQWEVYVPESYDGSIPHGTIVYINSDPGGRLFDEWKPVLEKYNLIWIVGFKAGNDVDPLFRHAMALEGLHQLRQRYNIDDQRIYLAGISGGGRAAGILMIMFADVFDGGWTICGINAIDRGTASNLLKIAKTRNRYVFMTGDNDFNRGPVRQVYDQYNTKGFQRTKFIQVTGMDHGQPSEPKWIEETFQFLDGPLTAEAHKHFDKAESYFKRDKYSRAMASYQRAAAHGGGAKFVPTAKKKIAEIRQRYEKELSTLTDLVEKGDLKIAYRQLSKFRKRWAGIASDDLAALSDKLKDYRKNGRPESDAASENFIDEDS